MAEGTINKNRGPPFFREWRKRLEKTGRKKGGRTMKLGTLSRNNRPV